LGQQIVIDNRAGAAGVIGSDMVAKAAPDGYTLLWAFSGPMVIVPQLNDSTPYDTLKDFAPGSLAVSAPYVLLVNPHVPAKTVKELVALAKARPGNSISLLAVRAAECIWLRNACGGRECSANEGTHPAENCRREFGLA